MSNRVDRAIEKKRMQERKRKVRVIKIVGVVGLAVGLSVTAIWKFNARLDKGMKNIDWNKISYEIDAVDVVEPVGGIVTQESYHKVRMAESARVVAKLYGILPIDIYNNLIEGIKSDYYKDVAYSEYTETIKEVKDMIAQSEYIIKMYDDYKSSVDFKDYDGCHVEDCKLRKFIESYTGEDLQKYLLDVHNKWESLVEYYVQRVEVDDNTLNMFYQEEITTNMDYVNSISIKAYVLNSELLKLDDSDFVEKLREKNKIPMRSIGVDNKEALEMLALYRSNKFYDNNIIGLAAPTMQRLFGDGEATNIIDLSDVEDIEQAIKNIKPPTEEKLKIMDMPYATYSLVERSTEDIIQIYYDIESIEHVDNIPKLAEIRDDIEYRAKIYIAEMNVNDELDKRITDALGDMQGTIEEGEHDHDGDGIVDHIYDEDTDEWLIYDGQGDYIRDTEVEHDHDGDGKPDH